MPAAPLGRQGLLALLETSSLPISFGSEPTVMCLEQDGKYRIRELLVDPAAAANAAKRTRSPSWMPEHHYALGTPAGQIYVEAGSRAELLEIVRTMTLPATW